MGDKRKMPPPSSMVTRSRTRRQSSQTEVVVTSSPPLESRHSSRRSRFTNSARYSRQARAPTRPLSIPGDHSVAPASESAHAPATATVAADANESSKEGSNGSGDDGRRATTITVTRLAQRLPSPHNRAKRIRVSEPKPEESDLESISSDDEDEETLPTFHYESKHEEEEQHHEREDDSADVDLVSGRRLDVIAQNPDDALPVSELSDFDKLFMNTVNKQLSSDISLLTNDNNSNKPRWPKDKQDETMFSVLLNPDKRKATPPPPLSLPSLSSSPSSSALQSPAALSPTSDSLEDFVNYDSLLLDEQQSSGEESSSSSPTSSSRSSPVSETVPSVPLCGYRNRNKTTIEAPANNKAFMAVLSSMADGVSTMSATALYQQALIAASGLNRRSLWSGKAREMVSGDLEW
uniref:ARAD1D19448p n=1 Tax=Blastobotrys adeninivorans TaxID=409370 RepID=A0A060T9L7_BLAAD